MEPVVISLPGNEAFGRRLAERLGVAPANAESRRFPDGEDYIRLPDQLSGRDVVLVCTMHPADETTLQLLFAAETARDLGASRVGLVAPYLGYMRQDRRFHPGEGVTSLYFARMVSRVVDWLVTVDPHLHRWSSLDHLYTIPTAVIPAAPDIASWLVASVESPVLIGPDAESHQWVTAVAEAADAPHVVLSKTRHGDRDVEITPPSPAVLKGRTPVIVDDIISTGQTMIECVRQLAPAQEEQPLCIGTHAVFVDGAYDDLVSAGVRGVVTCNTINHRTNGIDVGARLCDAVLAMCIAGRR